MNTDSHKPEKQSDSDIGSLLEALRVRFVKIQKQASLAEQSASLSPIAMAGGRIRAERKKQRLTLNALCELSGVAYATLNKIEQGHPSVRLDSLVNVTRALGMKLWIG